ncbi:MAG TPA: energy transducer TonB [Candidatus Binatia bacterium]|nr:energy transducer TonB [Candidatus Binatia bacterium]
MRLPHATAALVLLGWTQAHAVSGDLLRQVQEGVRSGTQANQEREQRFAQWRDEQAVRLREAQGEVQHANGRVAAAKKRWESARAGAAAADRKLKATGRDLESLYDAARGAAVDLHDLALRSLVSAQFPQRLEALAPMASGATPGAAELDALWQALKLEAEQGGQAARFEARVVRPGGERQESVIRIGTFTAFAGGDYLLLDAGGARFRPLPRPASRHLRQLASAFADARTGSLPVLVDPSQGPLVLADALRPGLFERLWNSGVGGYFIAGILAFALVLAIVQPLWLRSRLIIDEQSILVTVAVLAAFALIQWWLWSPRDTGAQDEQVAQVSLISEQPPAPEDEPPPPPEVQPPPPPPEMPTPQAAALAGLPALAAPSVAPLVSNITVPARISAGGMVTGQGFGGFARGPGTGASEGFGRGEGFSGKELIPLSTARPQMPEWACRQKIRGWVEAVFTVMPNGRVQDVKIVDAQPRGVYEIAAIESISNWIYSETSKARQVKQRVDMDPADCAYNWR